MSDTTFSSRSHLPDPASAPELFDGILVRRAAAFLVDCVLIGMIVVVLFMVGIVAGFLTFGLAWLGLFLVLPAAIVLFYAVTLGSPARATPGMRLFDLVLTPTRGQPLNGPLAFLHALVFYITFWISWPISLLFVLFTPRRQMIHDLITGTLMLRRSPMERHWRRMMGAG
jgi:uncharacterized RDD family membrane protein YckC